MYNDNYKIVYANELARGVIDEGITLEDQYNRLEKISIFNINEDLSKNIKKVDVYKRQIISYITKYYT